MFEDKRFEYDVYGWLVRKLSGHGPAKELALEYDDWNQLKTVVTKDRLGIATTHFEYDAFGRRIRKLNGSYASTDFLCDGMRLVQETYHDRQGEEALTYLYEANSYVPLARIDQGKQAANDADARDAVYYFHNDVSGLPEELTDAGGDLVWQARYKVWGNAVQEEWVAQAPQRPTAAWGEVSVVAPTPTHVPRPQNLRFQGQYLDRETGLHYNTFRFYDPDIGRFINPDPIGLNGGNNLYRYASNPVTQIDPWGLTCERLTGNTKADRVASEIDGAVTHANRMLDKGLSGNIPWGRIYQNIKANNPDHWLLPLAKGNAVQQIADTTLRNNRYLQDASVVFNQGHLMDVRNSAGNLLRPDYQIYLPGGKLGVFNITTPGQGAKIDKYAADIWANIFY
ncbi:RHS repeat-associated core domain-containing protein [Burkholderia cepacia]|uniref:RHS repeat-associated core domain-containing protein n=1 Tax=Burkholderia cepacia TaxID=292 RepID=UPI002FDFC658